MASISFEPTSSAWRNVKGYIERKVLENGARRVLEVGAGACPLFDEDFLSTHRIDYTALDISPDELAKAPDSYHKVVADIASPKLSLLGQYDFIFSRMLAEHIKNGEVFHRNIHRLLVPGGRAFHFFPTLWALPFLVNKWLPDQLAYRLLLRIQEGRERSGKHGKFPAYYSWCYGPTRRQIRRFESLGYIVEEYIGFFGHEGYYKKIPVLFGVHNAFSTWLLRNPVPWLTSFVYLTLRKPSDTSKGEP